MAVKSPKIASKTHGRRQKAMRPYRAEVETLFPRPKPYGWRIYRRGGTAAIVRSAVGYTTETEAWNAAGSALVALERAANSH